MRRTQLAATWAEMRIWRVRVARWRWRTTWKAGVTPNSRAEKRPMEAQKSRTRQPGEGSSQAGAGGGHESAHDELADTQAGGGAEQAQQRALSEQLADEAGAAGADGDADGDLALAGDSAGEQQAAQVAAGDGQDQQDQGYDEAGHGDDLAGILGSGAVMGAAQDAGDVAAGFAGQGLVFPDPLAVFGAEGGREDRNSSSAAFGVSPGFRRPQTSSPADSTE